MDALLWLTPTNPYHTNAQGQTVIRYAFGTPDMYEVYDPESTVDRVTQVDNWQIYEQQAALSRLIGMRSLRHSSTASWYQAIEQIAMAAASRGQARRPRRDRSR